MKKLSLVVALMTMTSIIAHAKSSDFSGFYVGIGTGLVQSSVKTNVSQQYEGWVKSKKISLNKNKNINGIFINVYSGYGIIINSFYFGGEVSVLGDFINRKLNLVNATDPAFATIRYMAITKYKRGISFGIGPRFGYVFGTNLIYIKPGIEVSRDQMTATYDGTNSARPDKNISVTASAHKINTVFTPSFGYEKTYDHIVFRAEYTYNPGKKIWINSTDKHLSEFANASYSDHRLMVGIAYKF